VVIYFVSEGRKSEVGWTSYMKDPSLLFLLIIVPFLKTTRVMPCIVSSVERMLVAIVYGESTPGVGGAG
jgi:hypothetical protein